MRTRAQLVSLQLVILRLIFQKKSRRFRTEILQTCRIILFFDTMFDNLSDKLDKAMHVLKGHGSITEVNVAETLKEVRRALLDADVNFKIAKDFTNTV
ncbi:MAG: hypothetical protein ACI825_001430, partial [Planctomycetota bacterium]